MLVGELLHKSMKEIDEMGFEEVGQWLAYIKVKSEREEKAAAAAKRRGSRGRRGL